LKFDSSFWSIIIGGSSGIGLATAQKLAAHGMNLCIVHRDRRADMRRIESDFERIRGTGVKLTTFNLDALSETGRTRVLDEMSEELNTGKNNKVRMFLHSVAFGNLKLLVPYQASGNAKIARKKIAQELKVSESGLNHAVKKIFEAGDAALFTLADPSDYENRQLLDADDFSRTIQAMGTNIVEWVQDIFQRNMFFEDARVLGLTSQGNNVAWRGYAAVAAAKSALESVSRAMAVELAPYGIRSNMIQAGVTDTAALQAIPGNQLIKANAALRNPFGRLTTPKDVANVIYLMCLNEAAWINGSLICADGGERIT